MGDVERVRQQLAGAMHAVRDASESVRVAAQGGEVVGKVVSTLGEISDSRRRIADIIDGIAFQTNILALNAAVEAAREIKALIRASVDRVETGARPVQGAGSSMSEFVTPVRRVSDLIGEITSATQEQTAGIGEVSRAVGMIDQVMQQNAALVEQSAAAAESLRQQALRLVEAVGVFRLDGASHHPHRTLTGHSA
jgi:methyl-accepting chemotaxis protein